MDVYGIPIPNRALSNFELSDYVQQLNIPNFRTICMRDELPKRPWPVECGIVNFNTSMEPGTHWVAYYKNKKERIYFDSFGQVMLAELKDYLKTDKEKQNDEPVIQRNTDIVQNFDTQICGHLCLFVLKSLCTGKTFRDILDFLTEKTGSGIQWTNNMANELHKPIRKKFLKRFVFVREVDDTWGSDLIELPKLSKKNSGFRYVLMLIDVFSKYGWAVPLKTKSGKEVASALQSIFRKKHCKRIWVDRGREYYNKDVAAVLRKYNIQIYSTNNDEKCSVVERFNRTIKNQLYRYFSANGTQKYTDILQPLIDKYNSTKHHSIGMTPIEARKQSNYQQVFKNLYFKKVQARIKVKPKYKVGDKVRISIKKPLFEKGFTINWSDKVYTITQILNTLPPTYRIKDDREEINGSFYEQELQKTSEETFRIEKILRWKKSGGKEIARVKWVGYDSSYNSWIPKSAITKYGDN